MKMRCRTCKGQPYSCIDPIVLARLPDFVRDELPWDWRWPFESVYLDKAWTDMFRYDVIKRQGAKNLAEKVMIGGAKTNDAMQVKPLPNPNTSPSLGRAKLTELA